MRAALLCALLVSTPAFAQSGSITLFEGPFFVGRSVVITSATPDLNTLGFAKRAQSARVSGSWQVCPEAKYGGACQTLSGDQKALALFGLGGAISSVRTTAEAAAPAPTTTTAAATTTPAAATTTAATGPVKVDLNALDPSKGTPGQDTTFFVKPLIGQMEVAAGSNDKTTADAFCKLAGYSSSVHASRARVQASNLIDLTAATKGNRAYPLRDVLCTR